MLVTLIGNNRMYKLSLSDSTDADYWISDNSEKDEIKLANIKNVNGKWILNSNKYSKIINEKYIKITDDVISTTVGNDVILPKSELNNYTKYYISPKANDEIYMLFCSPSYEKNIISYSIKSYDEITIGSGLDCDITINDNLVSNVHACIYKKNGTWMLENYDLKFKTYINKKCVDDESEKIANGDIIFICGIKIMILRRNNKYIWTC